MACDSATDLPTITLSGEDLATSVEVPVYTATTAAERMAGLGAYPQLPSGRGLVLIFPVEGQVCLTNEPVLYPIDAILVDADGLEVGRRCDWPSGSNEIECWEGVKYVLEMRSGELCSVGDALLLDGLESL